MFVQHLQQFCQRAQGIRIQCLDPGESLVVTPAIILSSSGVFGSTKESARQQQSSFPKHSKLRTRCCSVRSLTSATFLGARDVVSAELEESSSPGGPQRSILSAHDDPTVLKASLGWLFLGVASLSCGELTMTGWLERNASWICFICRCSCWNC